MVHNVNNIPLGEVPLDSAQTIRKAWDNCALGHRVVPVNVNYNIVEKVYNDDGFLSTVYFYHESDAESTKVTFVADASCSLIGTSFAISSKDDERIYKAVYVLGSTYREVVDGSHVIINVGIQTNDPKEVVALATKNAIDLYGGCYFTTVYNSSFITITNVENGLAADVTGGTTGFTFEILQRGTKTLVESYLYTYDAAGNLTLITSSSGLNVLNLTGSLDNTTSISGNGNKVGVTTNNELRTKLAPSQDELLHKIVDELRILNLHMSIMTDNDLTKTDLVTKDNL